MRKASIYKSGDIYGSLMLTGKSYMAEYGGESRRFVEVICDCGKIIYKYFSELYSCAVKSCGCKKKQNMINRAKHGMARDNNVHPIYQAWQSMKDRCNNQNNIAFPHYGGRGIGVYPEWIKDPVVFYNWAINNGWKEGLTLDRFPDVNGNYEPSNCRWATDEQQARNKRSNHWVTAFGETKCLEDWTNDDRCKVSHSCVFYRISILNWSVHDALFKPNTRKKKCRE